MNNSPTLSQKCALNQMLGGDIRIREVFDVTGGKLYEAIDKLNINQYRYLRDNYERKHIIKVKQFLHDKLPTNDNPCPF